MHTFASIVVGLLLFVTVGTLLFGVFGMALGQSGARSNQLMRFRVLLQAITLVFLILFISLLRS